jgi:hypothetical protein
MGMNFLGISKLKDRGNKASTGAFPAFRFHAF